MKYTIEELQFAATVRQIVSNRRLDLTRGMTDAEKTAFNERPVNDMVLAVLKELDGIAHVITRSRQEGDAQLPHIQLSE